MHLRAFETEIEASWRRSVALDLDVRDQAGIERMVSEATAAFGQIHILVNNAGCNVRKPALEVTWDDWNLVLDTNLRGSFFVAQAVARGMIAHGYGRIINIGSVTSVFGLCGAGALRGEPRRDSAAHHEPCRRLGQARHYGELPSAGLVQDGAERGALRESGVGGVFVDRIPVKRPGRPHDLDGAGRVPGVGGKPLHYGADAAGGWRDLDRRDSGDG